jgi:hypothetical protein
MARKRPTYLPHYFGSWLFSPTYYFLLYEFFRRSGCIHSRGGIAIIPRPKKKPFI